MYYGVVGLLLLGAFGFVCWPLWRPGRTRNQPEHDQAVRVLYQSRMDELQGETDDETLLEEIQTELGAVLLSEVQPDAQVGPESVSSGTASGWLLAVLIPVLGLATYLTVAEPGLQAVRGAEAVLSLSIEEDVALNSWALKLQDRVSQAPKDSKSWYLLGHSLLKLQRFDEAAEAFATASQSSPMDVTIRFYWLQSRYLAAGGQLDDTSRGMAQSILAQQPGLPVVIEMLAIDALHQGDSATAVSLLNQAISGAADPRQQASFARAIAQIRSAMDAQMPGFTVSVMASEEPPVQATVFVIARPVGGGMPYAVVRRPALLLPLTVRLDDLVAMSDERKLSGATDVEVVVRLSRSGNAMPEADDWQWVSSPLRPVSEQSVTLDVLLTPP